MPMLDPLLLLIALAGVAYGIRQRLRRPQLWMNPELLKALKLSGKSHSVEGMLQPMLQFFYQVTQGAGTGIVLFADNAPRVYTHPAKGDTYDVLFAPKDKLVPDFFQKLFAPLQCGRSKPEWLALDVWKNLDAFCDKLNLAWMIPIMYRGEHHGVVLLEHLPTHKRYQPQELKLVNYVVDLLGLSLSTAKLYELSREKDRRMHALKASLVDFSDRSSDSQYLMQKRYQAKLWKADQKVKELQAALQARKDQEAVLRHELKAPVSAMVAYFEELLSSVELSEVTQAALRVLHEEAWRLGQMVSDLGNVSANPKAATAAVSVATVLQEAVTIFDAQARQAQIALKTHLADPQVQVLANPGELRQVLHNLISNAIKYSPAHTQVEVETCAGPSDRQLQVAVRDHGGGIGEEYLTKIFEANVRLPHNSKRASGQGLGLAICKDLVEQWGGRIWAQNKNGGSEFCFTLPLQIGVDNNHATNTPIEAAHTGSGR